MELNSARRIADFPERFNAAENLLGANLAAGRGDKAAIIDNRGALSYGDLAERVDRMAGAWESLGVRPGDRVLLCLLDTRDFPTVFLGAIKAGVVPVPLNTLMTADDYRWILKNSDARAVFVTGDLAEKWGEIAEDEESVLFISSEGGPWPDLEDVLRATRASSDVAPTRRDDTAFWLYTSGSTGRPKGAMHRHASMRLAANLYGRGAVGMHEDDVVFSVAKQFFAYGLGNSLIFPCAVGATAILHRERVTPDVVDRILSEHPVSFFAGVPTFYAGWLRRPNCPDKTVAASLRLAISAGEALPAHLGEAFRARFGVDIHDGLGSTEMLHIFLTQRPGAVRYGCTGKPVDGYAVRLVDDDGREVGEGEIGNLHVNGPTSASAYWRNPEKSAAAFQGEWTVTGDKYIRDADGWYTYAGRGDDMLKVGGIYVSPIEVEEALACHEDVVEAAVVGAEDEAGLVKPHAFVVLREGVAEDEPKADELRAHVKSKLAPYKYPRWISFVDELPKTATGKIQRFRLRDQA